jgi:large subunit ribosomal protein L6e
MSAKPTTKKFGKSTREVPAPSAKAQKWYPADDENEAKQVSCGDDDDVGDATDKTSWRPLPRGGRKNQHGSWEMRAVYTHKAASRTLNHGGMPLATTQQPNPCHQFIHELTSTKQSNHGEQTD